MWRLTKSRGQFDKRHEDFPVPSAEGIESILGGVPTQQVPRGNFQVFHDLMSSVELSDKGRSSEGVYAGLAGSTFTGRSDAAVNGAWIALSERYVRLLKAVTSVYLQFHEVTLAAEQAAEVRGGEEHALALLGNARASAFAYVGAILGKTDLGATDDDIWDAQAKAAIRDEAVRSAMLWTICHELAHLTQGDGGADVNLALRAERAAAAASRMPAEMWPTTLQHQDELLADWVALTAAVRSLDRAGALDHLMFASVLATTTLTIDGWFYDQSAVSTTHPSPSLRSELLPVFWCHFLQEERLAGWPEGGPPSAEGLQLVARAVVFSRWIAGVYREGRDGFAVGKDHNEMLGHFLAACDMTAVILEPF